MKSSSTGGLIFLLALISSISVLQAEEGGKSPLTKRTKARGAILGGQNTKLVRDAPAEGAASRGKSASKRLQAIAIDVFGTCAKTDRASPVPSCSDDENEALEWFLNTANLPPGFEMNNKNWMRERLILSLFQIAAHMVPDSSTPGWMTISDHCTWQGVGCAPFGALDGNMITSLDLHGNVLTGTIPSEIASLTNLRTLDLHGNQLGGTIPLEIGNMASLIILNLSDNHDLHIAVTSTPSSFCNTTPYCVLPTLFNKLQAIAIDVFGTCADTGSGYPLPTCGDDQNEALEWFLIIDNHPTGFEMNNENWMSERLTLALFQIVAQVPISTPGWMTISDHCFWQGVVCTRSDMITYLDMGIRFNDPDGNILTGTIPSEIATLANLTYLNLRENQLGGTLPSEIGNMASLTYLHLDGNQFGGTIPSEIATLANLMSLVLSSNNLTGTIPSEIGNMASLTQLYLGRNELGGTIPSEITTLANLMALGLSSNNLTGTIPLEIANLANLMHLSLDDNQFGGTIPSEIATLANLMSLALSSNNLAGTIPLEIGNMANLTRLNLRENQLGGTIPSEIAKLANLTYLYLGFNNLTGTIPLEIGNMASLTYLSLHMNQLRGTIPSEIGNMASLTRLYLFGNQVGGTIPSEIATLTNLLQLSLSSNNLTGTIPSEIGKMDSLTSFDVWGNPDLDLTVPPSFCNTISSCLVYL